MTQTVSQINAGMTINVDVSVKTKYISKKYVWNRSTCICENGKYLAGIMDDSVVICDKVIESNDEEIKTIPISFNEENKTCKAQKFLYFTSLFINYHCIIDGCYYILLYDKISRKTKTFISIL